MDWTPPRPSGGCGDGGSVPPKKRFGWTCNGFLKEMSPPSPPSSSAATAAVFSPTSTPAYDSAPPSSNPYPSVNVAAVLELYQSRCRSEQAEAGAEVVHLKRARHLSPHSTARAIKLDRSLSAPPLTSASSSSGEFAPGTEKTVTRTLPTPYVPAPQSIEDVSAEGGAGRRSSRRPDRNGDEAYVVDGECNDAEGGGGSREVGSSIRSMESTGGGISGRGKKGGDNGYFSPSKRSEKSVAKQSKKVNSGKGKGKGKGHLLVAEKVGSDGSSSNKRAKDSFCKREKSALGRSSSLPEQRSCGVAGGRTRRRERPRRSQESAESGGASRSSPSFDLSQILFTAATSRRRSRRGNSSLSTLASRIASSQNVLFITGAGLSVPSGVRPFRGRDGLWGEVVWSRATRESFRDDPLGWYNDFWLRYFDPTGDPEVLGGQGSGSDSGESDGNYVGGEEDVKGEDSEHDWGSGDDISPRRCEPRHRLRSGEGWHQQQRHSPRYLPNAGHEALSHLCSFHRSNCRIITQNIDGLHTSTSHPWDYASRLIEAHGRLGLYKCIPESDSDTDSDDDDDEGRRVKLGMRRKVRELKEKMERMRMDECDKCTVNSNDTSTGIVEEDKGVRSTDVVCSDTSLASESHLRRCRLSGPFGPCRYQLEESIPAHKLEPPEVRRLLCPRLYEREATKTLEVEDTLTSRDEARENWDDGGISGESRIKGNTSSFDDGAGGNALGDGEGRGGGGRSSGGIPVSARMQRRLRRSEGLSCDNSFSNYDDDCSGGEGHPSEVSGDVKNGSSARNDPPDSRRCGGAACDGPVVLPAPPLCPSCRRPCPPQSLLFDEGYHSHSHYSFSRMEDWINNTDAIVFVGTSFAVTVTDVALEHAREYGVPCFNFNVDDRDGEGWLSSTGRLDAENIVGDVSMTLPTLWSAVEALLETGAGGVGRGAQGFRER